MASTADRIYDRMSQDSQPTKVWTARDFADIGTLPHTNQLTKKISPPDYKSVIQPVARRDGTKVLVDGITAANDRPQQLRVQLSIEV